MADTGRKLVRAETRGQLRELTLADPATLNALTAGMLAELRAEIDLARRDPEIRAVLLTGEGKGFSSGANLATGDVAPGTLDLSQPLFANYIPTIMAMRSLPKPIVAAVNGVAAGAGLSLALACDLRIAARSARFIQVFVRIGVMPDAGSTWFLPRLIGPERARWMAMTGEAVDAATAQAWGLALEVVDDADLLSRARALAEQLARGPTRAIAAVKQAIDASETNGLAEQMVLEARLQGELGRTDDFAEGVRAFFDKRKAAFTGS
jgi:2-(1,2-epoxy-1,2-dihydrophenyl)acetyl-CoA isomerase